MRAQAIPQSWRAPSNLMSLVVIAAALLIGIVVGRGQWIQIIALAGFLVVLRWPVQLGLGAFALLVPFDVVSVIGGSEGSRSLTMLVGAIAAFSLFTRALLTRRVQSPQRVAYWWAGFVAWSTFTAIWALQPSTALHRLPAAGGLLALYIAATCAQMSEEEFGWINRLVIVGGVAAALFVCYEYYNHTFYATITHRASMIAGDVEADPNFFAASLLLPLSITVSRFLAAKKVSGKAFMLALVLIIGLAIFLTMSRGALVAIVVMIFIYLRRLNVNWRTLLPIVCLAFVMAFLPSEFFTRLEGAAATRGAGRLDIWVVGMEIFKHYGILGAGIGNFPVVYARFAGYAPHYKGLVRSSHNTYLNIAVEMGALGFLLFVGAVWREARAVKETLSQVAGNRQIRVVAYEAAFWSLLTSAVFLDLIWRKDLWLTLILLGIATRASARTQPLQSN